MIVEVRERTQKADHVCPVVVDEAVGGGRCADGGAVVDAHQG